MNGTRLLDTIHSQADVKRLEMRIRDRCRVGLPLTRVLLALNATAAVGSTLDLSQLTASVCRWTKWLLTFCATVFGALIGLQGIFAQSADTLALKTGKFLLSSGVPVVGRAISDAMGSVLAGLKMCIRDRLLFGAAAQFGIFMTLTLACLVNLIFPGMFSIQDAASRCV